MDRINSSPVAALESWTPTMFLVAGGLLLFGALGAVFGWLADLPASVSAMAGFAALGGIVVTAIGLLGLYPRLAAVRPELTRAGIGLVVVAVAIFGLGVTLTLFAADVPFQTEAYVVSLASFALGVTAMGAVARWTAAISPAIGTALFVVALPWYAFLVASLLAGFPVPVWLTFLGIGTMALGSLLLGYRLGPADERADRAEPAPDSTA